VEKKKEHGQNRAKENTCAFKKSTQPKGALVNRWGRSAFAYGDMEGVIKTIEIPIKKQCGSRGINESLERLRVIESKKKTGAPNDT